MVQRWGDCAARPDGWSAAIIRQLRERRKTIRPAGLIFPLYRHAPLATGEVRLSVPACKTHSIKMIPEAVHEGRVLAGHGVHELIRSFVPVHTGG